jgi:hypothetical protein
MPIFMKMDGIDGTVEDGSSNARHRNFVVTGDWNA